MKKRITIIQECNNDYDSEVSNPSKYVKGIKIALSAVQDGIAMFEGDKYYWIN